jgi:ABC-type multidrug transport system ATPase subunit
MNHLDPAIDVSGLAKQLSGRHVLRDCTFTLMRQEIVAVVGANGAGKTTLLRCLATATPPSAGTICWLAQPQLTKMQLRRCLGYAGHDSYLYPHLTVEENLLFAARMYGAATDADRVNARLSEAGLAGAGPFLCGRLSQGMRRRVSILRAIVHNPAIVLLDEPSAGLDQRGQGWLARILRELKDRHCCICFVTHERQLVTELADRVLELREGRAWEAPAHGVKQWLAGDSAERAA